ncbi:NADP-dependent oxidoreductase domain-containing protein [Hysterangium stoloniferum]|nr:NADP-dependent oxidoreductase domain-containing protein [Hysterangium stoloniferum]
MSNLVRTLNNGNTIPWVGFGTGTALSSKNADDAATLAITTGFRHLDGAQMYKNEDSLGRAVAKFPRASLWITTKLAALQPGETVREALQASLRRLGVDYVDLWLIHTPYHHREGTLKDVWKACEEVHREGLARNIGVSNFTIKHLEEIMDGASIEFHPYLLKATQPLLDFHKKHGIIAESFGGLAPLTKKPDGPATPVLKTVREAVEKRRGSPVTEAQVLFKWLEAKDMVIVTTSSREARLKEYLDAASVPVLTSEEVQAIDDAGSTLHYRRVLPQLDA